MIPEIIVYIGLIFLKLLNVLFVFVNSRKRKTFKRQITPIQDNLLLISASDLSKKILNQQIKCKNVVLAYIKRIEEVNPIINAVVEKRFNLALQEAELVDELLSNGSVDKEKLAKEKPLLGVPLTVKESIAVKGNLFKTFTYKLKSLV